MMILVYCRGNNDNDDDCIDLIDDRVGLLIGVLLMTEMDVLHNFSF